MADLSRRELLSLFGKAIAVAAVAPALPALSAIPATLPPPVQPSAPPPVQHAAAKFFPEPGLPGPVFGVYMHVKELDGVGSWARYAIPCRSLSEEFDQIDVTTGLDAFRKYIPDPRGHSISLEAYYDGRLAPDLYRPAFNLDTVLEVAYRDLSVFYQVAVTGVAIEHRSEELSTMRLDMRVLREGSRW